MSTVDNIVNKVYTALSDVDEGKVIVSFKRATLLEQLNILHTLQKLGLETKSYDLITSTWLIVKTRNSEYQEALKLGYKEILTTYEEALAKYKALRAEPNMTPSRFLQLLSNSLHREDIERITIEESITLH